MIFIYKVRIVRTDLSMVQAEGKQLYQISSRIGHSNYSTTINKYGHLSNEMKKEIANTTDKYL